MSETGRDGPVVRPRRLSHLLPLVSSALTFGLLLGLVIVAVASPVPGAAGSQRASATVQVGPFDVELGDLYVKPAVLNVPRNATFELRLRNVGQQKHSLSIDGADTPLLGPGESTSVTWGPFTESVRAWCTVAGHKESGMVLDILVEGSAVAGGATDKASGDDSAKIDFGAKPKDGWKPFDPTLKPAPGGQHHKVTLTAKEVEQEVAPGVRQLRWTFDGQVPGPVLRGRVGDLFTVTLVNGGSMEHSIDLHASKVAPDVEMRPVKPGGKLVYQFRANHAGIFYYHCGVAPMIHHIGNGMYGAVVVDPPGLPKADKELVFLQSELFTGPTGKPGDLNKMHAERPDAVVFNGYVNQYLHAPIQVRAGERIRIWVFNVGPNRVSSFHVIGSIFDTVYKEGGYLLRPGEQRGGSQSLDLGVAQGGFVELTFDRPGVYPFVTHVMADAHRGAMGAFKVGEDE